MDLFENPFYLLGASTRDNRRQVQSLAEDYSLLHDQVEADKILAALTKPVNRLTAEMSWILGIAPRKVQTMVSKVYDDPISAFEEQIFEPLSRANLISAVIHRLSSYHKQLPDSDYAKFVERAFDALMDAYEAIDTEDLLSLINEERNASGFPEVQNVEIVEKELGQRRQYYKKVIKQALDEMPSQLLIKSLSNMVQYSVAEYDECSILLDDVIDAYELEAQQFLQSEKSNIMVLIKNIKGLADSGTKENELIKQIEQMEMVVKNWDLVASPIQLSYASRGLNHGDSDEIAQDLRSLAIFFGNEHGRYDLSQRIIGLIREVFEEIDEIAELAEQDFDQVLELEAQHIQYLDERKRKDAEWEKEITYRTKIGLFQNRLEISPEGILWKDKLWPLESISSVRWGATRKSINGIPTGTEYLIYFGNGYDMSTISTRDGKVFEQFIDCFWKGVCVPLLVKFVSELSEGKKFRFSSELRVDDYGVELEKYKFFGDNEKLYYPWSDVVIWNQPGMFCIGERSKKVKAALSYQEVNNVHILESAIRIFFKQPGDRLSSILGGD